MGDALFQTNPNLSRLITGKPCNVGKTIINHAQFHRWYTPFPNGWFMTLFYPHYSRCSTMFLGVPMFYQYVPIYFLSHDFPIIPSKSKCGLHPVPISGRPSLRQIQVQHARKRPEVATVPRRGGSSQTPKEEYPLVN